MKLQKTTYSYSVVITTYNGEKYIIEQLDSIRNQSMPPSEVLIFDDCSTDSTELTIKDYLSYNKLDWRFSRNEHNLGWEANFIQGISKAICEYIFTCDQDDIWEVNKCEIMIAAMVKENDCNLLVSNYKAIYMDRNSKRQVWFKTQSNSSKLKKMQVKPKYLISVYRPGCVYLFKKEFFHRILPAWKPSTPHDRHIMHYAMMYESVYHINYISIKFRRHSQNNTPLDERTVESRIHDLGDSLLMLREYAEYLDDEGMNSGIVVQCVNEAIKFCTARRDYYLAPRFWSWVVLVIKNFQNYQTLRSWLGDLYIGVIRQKLN